MDDDDDDLNLDSAGEEDDDDHQVAVLAGGLKHLKCSEDDDFMTAFDTMVTENIQVGDMEYIIHGSKYQIDSSFFSTLERFL